MWNTFCCGKTQPEKNMASITHSLLSTFSKVSSSHWILTALFFQLNGSEFFHRARQWISLGASLNIENVARACWRLAPGFRPPPRRGESAFLIRGGAKLTKIGSPSPQLNLLHSQRPAGCASLAPAIPSWRRLKYSRFGSASLFRNHHFFRYQNSLNFTRRASSL